MVCRFFRRGGKSFLYVLLHNSKFWSWGTNLDYDHKYLYRWNLTKIYDTICFTFYHIKIINGHKKQGEWILLCWKQLNSLISNSYTLEKRTYIFVLLIFSCVTNSKTCLVSDKQSHTKLFFMQYFNKIQQYRIPLRQDNSRL